jgi:hypothetical protein
MAQLGDFAGADGLIGKTPLDCDLCVRARGQIAALRRDWRAVDYWFGMVAAARLDLAPSEISELARMRTAHG